MQEINDIQRLLDKTGSIIEKHEAIARETGCDFNIFEIAGIETDERKICRVLVELLSPSGRHRQGGAYLKEFLSILKKDLNLDVSDDEIDKASITLEHYTDEGRPIDIVIKVSDRFIPIEVKIYAGDQQLQCLDYHKHARMQYNEAKIIYLTLSGSPPSTYSTGNGELLDKDIIQISFSEDILGWLEKCLSLPDTINKAPIQEVLIQFISTIKKITNKMEEQPMHDIIDLLSESPENVQAALEIYKLIEKLRVGVIERIDNELLNKHGFKKYNDYCASTFKTYYTNSPDVFFRLQYEHETTLNTVVCFLAEKKTENKKELVPAERGRKSWNFIEISRQQDFHLLFDDGYFQEYIVRVVKFYSKLNNDK